MDIQLMKDNITGLIEQGKELRRKEAVFLKIQGIEEEIAKGTIEKDQLETQQANLKKDILELKEKKRLAVEGTVLKLTGKMNEVLPSGEAVFNVENGVFIGWKNPDGKTIPYDGLSGGQKAAFDASLAHALKANILAIEAAEIDDDNIINLLAKLENHDAQILVMTCHNSRFEIVKDFHVVEIGGAQ